MNLVDLTINSWTGPPNTNVDPLIVYLVEQLGARNVHQPRNN